MCGIAGFYEFKKESITNGDAQNTLIRMLDTIKHRGPDGYGMSFYGYGPKESLLERTHYYPSTSSHLALGHRRLSIIDLSEDGFQPMLSFDNQFEIVFNGEIYNYVELKEELKDKYHFKTTSDTEVLLTAYKHWGVDMLNKLDGMFAFAIWDRENERLFCARDSMSIKPFYYNLSDKGLLFGSEPKTILAGLNTHGTIDKAHTAEFLLAGLSDSDEGTFFNEVKQLPGGHYFMLDKNSNNIQLKSYWTAPSVTQRYTTQKEYSDEYYNVIIEAVTRQLRSDVPVGTSLSGGIDSSTIVTIAGELLKDKADQYNTLTFTFPGHPDDESQLAKSIAAKANMKWHPIEPSIVTLVTDLDRMIEFMGEPFSSLSMFAQYKVMEEAQHLGLKVMLDGQGGDEIYLGYPRVAQRGMFWWLGKGNIKRFLEELNGLEKHASVSKFRAIASHILFSNPAIANKRNKNRTSVYVKNELLKHARPRVLNDLYASKNVFNKQIDELTKYCLPRLLRYADRNSMAFSVESRVPHLSNLTRDFALSLPLLQRVNKGWTKYTVRKAMEGKISDTVLWNPVKRGFDIPQSYWISVLETLIKEWIDKLPEDGFFNKKEILHALQDENKKGDFTLWRVLSVIGWMAKTNVKIN